VIIRSAQDDRFVATRDELAAHLYGVRWRPAAINDWRFAEWSRRAPSDIDGKPGG
jgi:hypothetical protein